MRERIGEIFAYVPLWYIEKMNPPREFICDFCNDTIYEKKSKENQDMFVSFGIYKNEKDGTIEAFMHECLCPKCAKKAIKSVKEEGIPVREVIFFYLHPDLKKAIDNLLTTPLEIEVEFKQDDNIEMQKRKVKKNKP